MPGPDRLGIAREVAGSVTDPELPMLTLADLGVLRRVTVDGDAVVVAITPTYSGCPALATMREDLERGLRAAGFAEVRVEVELRPAWSTDDISGSGRAALARHGISPPGPAPRRDGPVPLGLRPPERRLGCPRCGSADVEATSEFGATPCTALYRCLTCGESFAHVKEI